MVEPTYHIDMVKNHMLDKTGRIISVVVWQVYKHDSFKELFYTVEDASRYVEIMEKRDADYASLVEQD